MYANYLGTNPQFLWVRKNGSAVFDTPTDQTRRLPHRPEPGCSSRCE